MTDLVVTPANVVSGVGAVTQRGIAGATILAGQSIYKDPTTGKILLSDSNSATAAARHSDGIALCGAALNQPVEYQNDGNINLGATLTVGTMYVASETPGGIEPTVDLASGEYVSIIGVATAANNLMMGLLNSGAAVP